MEKEPHEEIRADGGMGAELLPLVYDELRRLAAERLRHERPGQTLQATALVHEAYVRLSGTQEQRFNSRGHFFCAAAEAIRRILIERARRKKRSKRGGGAEHVPIEDFQLAAPMPDEELLAVDEALKDLETVDSRAAELVKLRFFVGLTQTEAAEHLGVSRSSADRSWAFARPWLFSRIRSSETTEKQTG